MPPPRRRNPAAWQRVRPNWRQRVPHGGGMLAAVSLLPTESMRIALTLAFAAAVTAAHAAAPAASPPAPEPVEIAQEHVALKGVLFRPDGSGPFPAVVGLHGCEGLLANGAVTDRYRDWAQHLVTAGFVVLYPD